MRDPSSQQSYPSFCNHIDKIILGVVVCFYGISFILIYPGFALLPNSDISRHFASSIILGRTPHLYIGYSYIFAHAHESAFLFLSNAPMVIAQVSLLGLIIIMPLAFYIAAKRLLCSTNSKIPVLATIFWVLFANGIGGFAWIVFVSQKILVTGLNQLQLLAITAQYTYNGTYYAVLGLWYVPAIMALILLLCLFVVIHNMALTRTACISLVSVIYAGMYLTHVIEASLFAIFITLYILISKNPRIRSLESVVGLIIGLLVVLFSYLFLNTAIPRFGLNSSLLLSVAVPLISLSLVAIVRFIDWKRIFQFTTWYSGINRRNLLFGAMAVTIVIYCYTIAVLIYGFSFSSFLTSQVNDIGFIPWFVYPMVLGLCGLFGIIAIYFVIKSENYRHAFAFIISFLIFTFIFARFVSFTNLTIIIVGFWEKRFVWYLIIPLALLAPVTYFVIVNLINKKVRKNNFRKLLLLSLIGLIVVSGISTTYLNVDYWNQTASNSNYYPDQSEFAALNSMYTILENDPYAWVVTLSARSKSLLTFACPPDQLRLSQLLYSALTPEMGFLQLYRHSLYSHPFIYIAERDEEIINNHGGAFLSNYLQVLPEVFRNNEITIFNSSASSFPQEESRIVLVYPQDNFLFQDEILPGYYLLSSKYTNYTVAYDLDNRIFNSDTLLLGFDPPLNNFEWINYTTDFSESDNQWDVLSGKWNFNSIGLRAGDPLHQTNGIILAPILIQNATITFTFSPLDYESDISNYVALVHSFQSANDYRLAELHFLSNGSIYVLTRHILGGTVEEAELNPQWPGNNTGLNWERGENYEVNLLISDRLTTLEINGHSVLSLNSWNKDGHVGLYYNRFNNIVFSHFSINGFMQKDYRPINEYLQYANNGGTVIILNSNGNHAFAQQMLIGLNNTIQSQLIMGESNQVILPAEIPIQVYQPLDGNSEIIANYTSTSGENSVYIIRQPVGNGHLYFVNIYPILQGSGSYFSSNAMYELFRNLLIFIDLPEMIRNNFPVDAYTRQIELFEANLYSNSVLFPLDGILGSITVTSEMGMSEITNVTHMILDASSIEVQTNRAYLQNGRGIYTKAMLNSSFQINILEPFASLKVNTTEGYHKIEAISHILIEPNTILDILLRFPRIEANASIFTEFYSFGSLYTITGAYGHQLSVIGQVFFSIGISDTYTVLRDFQIYGERSIHPPLTTYNPLTYLPITIFWVLLLFPFFIIIWIILRKFKSH